MSSAKEHILKRIRDAVAVSTPIPFPHSEGRTAVFTPSRQENEIEFAEQFTKLQGKFVYCADHGELAAALQQLFALNNWKNIFSRDAELISTLWPGGQPLVNDKDLAGCDASVTGCELLIARTGSIMLSAALPSGRTGSVYAPVHLCVAYTRQLVYDIREGLGLMQEKYAENLPSLITLATGPSRTADIEKTLVVGVHGPREVYVFLVDA